MLQRILIVNEFFSYGDGSSLYIIKLAETLTAAGCKVEVLYGTKRAHEYTHPAITTHFVPGILGFNYSNTKEGLNSIKKTVRAFCPDIIFIHQVLNPRVISLLAGLAPAIRYEHGFRLSCPTGRRMPRTVDEICLFPFSALCMVRAHTQQCMPRNPLLAVKRVRDVYKNINAHKKLKKTIVASGYIKDLLVRSGFAPNSVTVVPYFVDAPEHVRPHQPSQRPHILFVGRLEYEKGAEFLVQALSIINTPSHVTLIGDGPELKRLEVLASTIPNHAFAFPGWVDNASLKQYYENADIMVIPSIWPEPFGIIGLEAMSFGVPVVAFDVGGIPDWLVHGKTGLLVPRKDIHGLAESIGLLIKDKELAHTMGNRGRELVLHTYTRERHMAQLMDIFNNAMAQHQHIHGNT